MNHRTVRGAIGYTSNKPLRQGQERGREYFIITDQTDGVRVVHAHCEIAAILNSKNVAALPCQSTSLQSLDERLAQGSLSAFSP